MADPTLGTHAWGVNYTLPKDPAAGRSWAKNCRCTVFCRTIGGALDLVVRKHPGATVFAIHHRGAAEELLVEDGAFEVIA